ncbi:MAG: hypothetical protein IPO62_04650 [Saprospiraceae bacterium]|nr:hypothetical protein [Saprospiraceae bacterium]
MVVWIVYISCNSDIKVPTQINYNFSINGDTSTPLLFFGMPKKSDSSLCFKIKFKDTLWLKPIGVKEQVKWQLKSYGEQEISALYIADKEGIYTISMLDSIGRILVTKGLMVVYTNLHSMYKNPIGKIANKKFNCDNVFFSNSRFDGTISGLPDGIYQVEILENGSLKQYSLQSKSGQGHFKLGTSYDQRPQLKLKRIQNTDHTSINCLFL